MTEVTAGVSVTEQSFVVAEEQLSRGSVLMSSLQMTGARYTRLVTTSAEPARRLRFRGLLASGVRSGGSRGGNYYVPDSHKNPIVLHIGAAATTKIDGSLLPFELRSHTQSFSLAAISPLEAACWTNRKNPMSLRILVVDDDPASLGSLCRLLKLRGYTVHELTDPTAALDEAVEFQPHVVILDYLMPRMHGGDVAWQLASNPLLRDVRVIVSSAYSAEEIRRNLPPTKIPILPKPIDFDALLQLIWDEGSYRTADS